MLSTLKERSKRVDMGMDSEMEKNLEIITDGMIKGLVKHGESEIIINIATGLNKKNMRMIEELEKELEERCEKAESPEELVERIRKNCEKLELKEKLEKELKKTEEDLRPIRLKGESVMGMLKRIVNEVELYEKKGIMKWLMEDKIKWKGLIGIMGLNEENSKGNKKIHEIVNYYCSVNRLLEELGIKQDKYANELKELIRVK